MQSVTSSPPHYGTSSYMHQVTLHSTITHHRWGGIDQATYSKIATRDDTVVLPRVGGELTFHFQLAPQLRLLSLLPIDFQDRALTETDLAVPTSEINMLLVWSIQPTDVWAPCILMEASCETNCTQHAGKQHKLLHYENWP